MILSLCAILALKQAVDQTPMTPAEQLLGKMIQHYRDAKSLGGKIKLTQSAQGFSINIETTVAFDQPDKFLIRQVKTGGTPGSWLTVSDGKTFSYPKPEGVIGPDRLREPVVQLAGHQEVRGMYGASAATLGDRSAVLDLLIGRPQDLEVIRPRWTNLKIGTPVKIRGIDAQVIEGDFSDVTGAEPTGKFSFAITSAGDILRYATSSKYQVPSNPPQVVVVNSTWDVDVKVGEPNPDSTYVGG